MITLSDLSTRIQGAEGFLMNNPALSPKSDTPKAAPSMRERLKEIILGFLLDAQNDGRNCELTADDRQGDCLDAILCELREPDPQDVQAVDDANYGSNESCYYGFTAMIDHIRG